MTSAPTLLLLDDELYWLNRHQQHFQKHGFVCIPTLFAEHAAYLGVELEPIRYAVIDHILRDPTQPEDERENQRLQGKEVILEIAKFRPDIRFAIVTQALSREDSLESLSNFLEDLDGLDIQFIRKDEFDSNSDKVYQRIKTMFAKFRGGAVSKYITTEVQDSKLPLKTKILLLTSNPAELNRLDLGPEVRAIREVIERSPQQNFELIERGWVDIPDLLPSLLDIEPEIVHFCGHGLRGELALESDSGKPQLIPTNALADLFRLCGGHVKCVLLNACFTEETAKVIARYINHVVGMREAIGQEASKEFSRGFYTALTRGLPILSAYDAGRYSIKANKILEEDFPILIEKPI